MARNRTPQTQEKRRREQDKQRERQQKAAKRSERKAAKREAKSTAPDQKPALFPAFEMVEGEPVKTPSPPEKQ